MSSHPMSKNTLARVEQRRAIVAQHHAQGKTPGEIAIVLAQTGMINPDTKQPYGEQVIRHDLRRLQFRWQRESSAEIATHRARQYAELQAVKKAAWEAGDYGAVIRALRFEAALLGTVHEGGPRQVTTISLHFSGNLPQDAF